MISLLSLGFDFQWFAVAIALVIFAAAVRRGSKQMADALTQVGTALAGAMSGPFEQLKADIEEAATELAALRAENATLKTQVETLTEELSAATAPTGTSDAELTALDAELKAALEPAKPMVQLSSAGQLPPANPVQS